MTPEESNECFLLALAGAPASEIAASKQKDEEVVLRAIEWEAGRRVDTDEFLSLEDALEYLRLGRIHRGVWAAAARGSVPEARQVLDLAQKRSDLRRSGVRNKSLSDSVREMMNNNGIDLSEEQEDE